MGGDAAAGAAALAFDRVTCAFAAREQAGERYVAVNEAT